jgi:hypothetical protein
MGRGKKQKPSVVLAEIGTESPEYKPTAFLLYQPPRFSYLIV